MTQYSDDILVEKLKQGDSSAFEMLYQRYQKRVVAIAYGVVRNQQDAMDLSQEVFIKVYHNIDKFNQSARFYTWLYRVTVNHAIDFTRRRKNARHNEFDDEYQGNFDDATDLNPSRLGLDPSKEFVRQELRQQIEDAISKLSPKHREVIVLREIDGLSYQDIANVLEISIGTVMSRLHHARLKLQKLLAATR